ncbi:hypothetical protein MC28_A03 (plasmid) [Bacillus thuringiensis MC28]|nr:hypothetical protein MC28_A03 [Bacillus thuringiensis MC28]
MYAFSNVYNSKREDILIDILSFSLYFIKIPYWMFLPIPRKGVLIQNIPY